VATPEARLKDVGTGLAPVTEGWFVVNVRDAAWVTNETYGARGARTQGRVQDYPEQHSSPEELPF
jgi:hypothetical protein